MKCREIMKTDVITCNQSSTAQECAKVMRDNNIGFVPVVDDDNKVCGIVTDRDLTTRLLAEGKDANCKLSDCMTSEVVSCSPDDDVEECIRQMAQKRKSRMLVLDEGRIAGVISLSDVAQLLGSERSGETLRSVTKRESQAPQATV